MGIRIREVKNISILDIEGRIDINSSDIIETVGWLTTTGKVNLILNLENVDLVDYSGLSVLAIAYKNAVNHKGRLKLVHVSLPVIELFKVVKLDTVFEIYQDEEAAVNSFYQEEVERAHLRRKFKRLEIHLTAKYKIMGDQEKAKLFDGKVLNMSGAGIFVYSPYTFPINTMLDMEIVMPDTPSLLEANGRVVWLADREMQPHYSPGMGIAFIHLTPEKEKAVIDFIDKNVTHRAEPF